MSTPPQVTQPRYFWRRVLALFVDWLLVFLLTTLMLLPFLRPDTGALRLGGAPLSFTTCQNVTSVTPEIQALVAPEAIAKATLCEARPFGIYNGRTLKLVYGLNQSRSGAVTTSSFRTLDVALDGQDRVVQTFRPQSVLVPVLLMIASAMFIASSGRTPGKRLAGLQVQGGGCVICRELRRLGLFAVLGGLNFVLSLASNEALAQLAALPVWLLVAGGGSMFVLIVGLYIWPMIRWRGAMPYDRATGFEVVRAG